MTTIRVVEHGRLPIKKDGGERALTPHQKESLERLLPALPSGAIKWGHKEVRFSQHCGVIGLGGDTIEVLPKIYGRDDPDAGRNVLLRMLYLARRMNIAPVGAAGVNLQRHRLLDVFIRNFCEELFTQLRKGALLRYVHREDNLPVLRGRLLIDRQLKLNSGHQGRLYCAFDELVEDNIYNQYIKCALKVVHGQARSLPAKRATTELLYRFDGGRDYRPKECRNWSLPERRDAKRFESVFRQCGWFLRGLGQDVRAGERESLSVLFDMNRLFEDFIAAKLRKETRGCGFRVRAQGPQNPLVKDGDTPRFRMKPDITFNAGGRVLAILDTKWKVLSEQKDKYGIKQGDLYQMIAYGTRYQCPNLTLIYPKQDKIQRDNIELRVPDTDPEMQIMIRFVDLERLVERGLDAQLDEAVAEAESLAALPAAA